MKFLYILLAGFGLAGCYTEHKAVKQVYRSIGSYPDTTASILRAWKPCIVTYKDTTHKTDTLTDIISVECPGDTLWRTDTLETSYAVSYPKIIKVPMPRIRETWTITNNIKDLADNQVYEGRIRAIEKKLTVSNTWKRAGWIAAALGWLLFIIMLLFYRK